MAANDFRHDSENRRFERVGEGFPMIAFLRNTASVPLAACFEGTAIRPSSTRGRRREYRVQRRHDDALGRPRSRQALPTIKLGLRRWEKMTRKGYRVQTGANTVPKRESSRRPPKALRRKRAPKTYHHLPVYHKWQTAFSPAPAPRGDAANGAERERSEFRWLALNRQQYAGRWVALDGGALLAVGDSAREVYAAIASHEGTPLVTRVDPQDEIHFAGW
jgi:hypothetical protein